MACNLYDAGSLRSPFFDRNKLKQGAVTFKMLRAGDVYSYDRRQNPQTKRRTLDCFLIRSSRKRIEFNEFWFLFQMYSADTFIESNMRFEKAGSWALLKGPMVKLL